jgi:hypothetical protein
VPCLLPPVPLVAACVLSARLGAASDHRPARLASSTASVVAVFAAAALAARYSYSIIIVNG